MAAAEVAAGSTNKKPVEEPEDGDQPDLERQDCVNRCCSPTQTLSPSYGFVTSPIIVLNASGSFDEDLDDTILDPSDEEKPDSPTGLSREAEDELMAEDLETSPDAAAAGLNNTGDIEKEPFWPLRGRVKLLQRNGPSTSLSGGALCRDSLETLDSRKPLDKSSQIPAESSSSCNGLKFPGAHSDTAASMNREKGRGLSGVTQKQAPQTGTGQLAAQGQSSPAVGQAALDHKELRAENSRSDPLPGKASDAVASQGKRAASVHVNGAKKPSSPIKPPQRICVQEADLESTKERYINAVLNHASSVPPVIDSVQEMYTLVDTVASESRYEHPTDLTVRNYARRSQSTTQKCNLNQWMNRSLRNFSRFAGVPDRFERSPVLS